MWNRSPKAYQELHSSGVLVLPSGRLLQLYKNSISQEPGFNKEVFQLMHDEATKRNISKEGRCGGIMLDEMAIQEDLQLKQEKGTMKLVGAIDLGNEDQCMRTLQTGNFQIEMNKL